MARNKPKSTEDQESSEESQSQRAIAELDKIDAAVRTAGNLHELKLAVSEFVALIRQMIDS